MSLTFPDINLDLDLDLDLDLVLDLNIDLHLARVSRVSVFPLRAASNRGVKLLSSLQFSSNWTAKLWSEDDSILFEIQAV